MSPAPVAIVTGASRGLGAAISRRLTEDGIAVALLARGDEQLEHLATELRQRGGTCTPICCDVTRRADIEHALQRVEQTLGPPTILVNNAGLGGPFHLLTEVSDEEWQVLFDTNVRSLFWFCRAVLPGMKDRNFGRIVNISSVHGQAGAARSSTYIATKHAIIGYSRAIAAEWGAFGITCNAVCPGYVDTAMGIQPAQVADHANRVLARIPAARQATPQEIAGAASLLVGADGGYINGAALVIDGGLSINLGTS